MQAFLTLPAVGLMWKVSVKFESLFKHTQNNKEVTFSFFFFFCGTGIEPRIQGLAQNRQVLCPWATPPAFKVTYS
jgi:hypothetical protein